jgi:polygalacturonase
MAEEVRSIEILGTQYPIADTVARADATDAKTQAQQAINAVTQGAQNIAVSFKSGVFMSPPNS